MGLEQDVLSKVKKVGPYSFLSEHVLKTNPIAEAPPPTYQRYE
jgi:hypothetical protein